MSSADRLREAATQIRDTAEAATRGHWKLWGMQVRADVDGTSNVDTSLPVAHTAHERGLRTFNATHIALWDPPVALAVADLLDDVAADKDFGLATIHPRLLDLADLILGGQS